MNSSGLGYEVKMDCSHLGWPAAPRLQTRGRKAGEQPLDCSYSSQMEGGPCEERDSTEAPRHLAQLLGGTENYRGPAQAKQTRIYLHECVTLRHKVPFGDLLELVTDVGNTAGFQYKFLVLLN